MTEHKHILSLWSCAEVLPHFLCMDITEVHDNSKKIVKSEINEEFGYFVLHVLYSLMFGAVVASR